MFDWAYHSYVPLTALPAVPPSHGGDLGVLALHASAYATDTIIKIIPRTEIITHDNFVY